MRARAAALLRFLAAGRGAKIALAVTVAGLFAVEQVVFVLGSRASPPVARAPVHGVTLAARIEALVSAALGASDRGVRRYRLAALTPDRRHAGMRAVALTWAINGDLSLGSVSAGAQLDVYLVMQSLYSSTLPISLVSMTGTFGQRVHGHDAEVPVVAVSLDRATARRIPWSAMDAATVWRSCTGPWSVRASTAHARSRAARYTR